MMQCSECDLFKEGPGGQAQFRCHPFRNIKEPECLVKWQLIKLDASLRSNQMAAAKMDQMVRAYQATVDMYKKLAPLQEKMFRHMERELDDIDEGDNWKNLSDDDFELDEDDDSFKHP